MILARNMKEQFTYEILLKYKNNPYKQKDSSPTICSSIFIS